MNKGKIFVIYHSLKDAIKSAVYCPIAVGPNKDNFDSDFLRDDIGENIAEKNSRYNELTAIYWVFKHIDEFKDYEYIGFCHYRRFFCFNGLDQTAYVKKNIDQSLIDVDNDKLNKFFRDYVFICPRGNYYRSIRRHYEKVHDKEKHDIDRLLGIIEKSEPGYKKAAIEYLEGQKEYSYNMFVFKKETFVEYARFLFNVVDQFAGNYNGNRLYISERITGIFIQSLIMKGQTPLYLPILHVREKGHLKKNNEKGFMKIKPGLLEIMPRWCEQWLRRRKAR